MMPASKSPRRNFTGRALGICLLLPIVGCAAPKPQLAAAPPQPAPPATYSGTIIAVRPETSAQDQTGSLQRIMAILGQPAVQMADAAEIVMRMPDDTIKTSVQPPLASLTIGSKAAIAAAPAAIQPR